MGSCLAQTRGSILVPYEVRVLLYIEALCAYSLVWLTHPVGTCDDHLWMTKLGFLRGTVCLKAAQEGPVSDAGPPHAVHR